MSSVADLIAARVPSAIRELEAYVPDQAQVSVRLDANEAPPLLPTLRPDERAAFLDALASIEPARYPDVRASALRAAIAQSSGVDPASLVIGCGSDEVIAMLVAALAKPVIGDAPRILVPTPSFVMYRVSARVHGYDVVTVPLDADWDVDDARVIEAIEAHRPALVFLATPNNPTSGTYDRARVDRIVEAAGKSDPQTVVVIDEAYLPFRLGPNDPWKGATGLDLLARAPHVVVLRTLSKIGLAALRVGWAIAHPSLAHELEKVRLPYDLPSYSQVAATCALGPLAGAIERHVASIVAERARFLGELARIDGLSLGRTDANFVWLGLDRPARDVASALKQAGVLVRTFPAVPDRMRVTVGTPAQDDRFLEALRDALRERS